MATQIKFFDGFVKLFDGLAQEVPRKGEIVTFKGERYRVEEVGHVFTEGECYDESINVFSVVEITLKRAEDSEGWPI
jgi:hypothetical protein